VINQRVLLITGTGRGIGLGLARYYLQLGDIVCGCSRHSSNIEHPCYTHFKMDVSNEEAVVEMVRKTVRRHGRIDGLVNNAGVASMNHTLLSPAATARAIFDTNFHGTFLFCRETAKAMVREKFGRIINFSTVATPLRLEGESLYAASKAAVELFTEVLARELGTTGVTVNALGAAPIPTDLIKSVPRPKIKALLARQAIPRFGEVSDVTNVVDFFLSRQSGFISGQIIYLGGVNR
jgi:3-oxoacyl-[acyl-carrier protein] reductase